MSIYTITCNSLMATHELAGNPCKLGTRNCRHPDQCPMSNIMHIKLKILMNTLAMFKNYNENKMIVIWMNMTTFLLNITLAFNMQRMFLLIKTRKRKP